MPAVKSKFNKYSRYIHNSALLLIAATIILIIFPDVVFHHASIRPLQISNQFDAIDWTHTGHFLPFKTQKGILEGYMDVGAAAWQVDPIIYFMAHCIHHGESPYWNPYSAAGSLGPETLTDVKFSPINLCIALCNGDTLAYHVVMLLFYVIAVFFLIKTITQYLKLSLVAGIAAGFFFILGGFHLSYMIGAPGQPYILAPITLYAVLHFLDRPGVGRFIGAILGNALILCGTFLPTALLMMVFIHTFGLAFILTRQKRPLTILKLLALEAATPLAAFFLLAPVWFPILASFKTVSIWQDYQQGYKDYARLSTTISLLTPRLFWESYGGFFLSIQYNTDKILALVGPTSRGVYHYGIVGSLVAINILAMRKRLFALLPLTCLFFLILWAGRVFGIPPFLYVMKLPALKTIGQEYWGVIGGLSFCFLLAYGFDHLKPGLLLEIALFVIIGFVTGFMIYLYKQLGLPTSSIGRINIYFALGLLAVAFLLTQLFIIFPRLAPAMKITYLVLMVGELLFYMNTFRPPRYELREHIPPRVQFLKAHLGMSRFVNIGRSIVYPEWPAAFQLCEAGTMNSSVLPWYKKFYNDNLGNEACSALFLQLGTDTQREVTLRPEGLRLLGIKYATVAKYITKYVDFFDKGHYPRVYEDQWSVIYELPNPMPRAFAVQTLLSADTTPDMKGLPDHAVACTLDENLLGEARKIGVETPAPLSITSQSQNLASGFCGTTSITQYHNTRVALTANMQKPGVVVLMDAWHPNWRVRVDGRKAYLAKVNGAFRGVAVPAGSHQIVFSYTPPLWWPAVGVSLLVLGTLFALYRKRQWIETRLIEPAPEEPGEPMPDQPAATEPRAEPAATEPQP